MTRNRTIWAGVACLVLVFTGGGCPSGDNPIIPSTDFDIWLINSSANYSITSVKIADVVPEVPAKTTRELILDEGIPVNTIRLAEDIDVAPFDGKSLKVTVVGHTEGVGINPEVSVTVDTPITAGAVVPILITDTLTLSINVRYVPLETSAASSKSMIERIYETIGF